MRHWGLWRRVARLAVHLRRRAVLVVHKPSVLHVAGMRMAMRGNQGRRMRRRW